MEREYIELAELQMRIREGVEELFPSRVWVRAELASVQVKNNGHCYLELSQSGERGVVAKIKAIIWRSRYPALATFYREVTGGNLAPGQEIVARVEVSYSELYGMSLTIDEIEPLQTLGAAELRRRQTIATLEAEGMMDAQQKLSLPALPRRLAVISAENAAGYGDFCRHIDANPGGFAFSHTLIPATMQGSDAPASIADALARAETLAAGFDAVLIIRGGGSALDLACFDDYGLCLAIATCSLPVLTAVGHERDYHVCDMVAYDHLKTPTALADYFLDIIAAEDEQLSAFARRLRLALNARLSAMESRLDMLHSRILNADPRRILQRGYSLVTDASGVVLKSARNIRPGDTLNILFADASVGVTVN